MASGNITSRADVSSTQNKSTSAQPANAAKGGLIRANTYQTMMDVLNQLVNHNHTFYDDYTTVCDCQCQCQCGRGTT